MTDASILVRLFEHNNWANSRMIEVCTGLSDEQLDAEPRSATLGSIRQTLIHLVRSQQGYLALLTLPVESRPQITLEFADLGEVARQSGEVLLALAGDQASPQPRPRLRTRDGYFVEPWVVMLQVINHAGEHREQISSMLTDLGVTPPELDGWSYGEAASALVPPD